MISLITKRTKIYLIREDRPETVCVDDFLFGYATINFIIHIKLTSSCNLLIYEFLIWEQVQLHWTLFCSTPTRVRREQQSPQFQSLPFNFWFNWEQYYGWMFEAARMSTYLNDQRTINKVHLFSYIYLNQTSCCQVELVRNNHHLRTSS